MEISAIETIVNGSKFDKVKQNNNQGNHIGGAKGFQNSNYSEQLKYDQTPTPEELHILKGERIRYHIIYKEI